MKKLFSKLKQKAFLQMFFLVIVVVGILCGIFFFEKQSARVFIDNSLIDTPIINISPSTSEKLLETDVYESEKIKKGDPIAVVGSQTLRADTDGLVIMANRQIGSLVSPQNPVAQMINPSDMRVAGTIDENKGLSDIRVGQIASFTVDALPGKIFWGYVDEISSSAKQTQLAFSISSERPTQQFVIYTKFDSLSYPEIKNGMSAKMTIYTDTH